MSLLQGTVAVLAGLVAIVIPCVWAYRAWVRKTPDDSKPYVASVAFLHDAASGMFFWGVEHAQLTKNLNTYYGVNTTSMISGRIDLGGEVSLYPAPNAPPIPDAEGLKRQALAAAHALGFDVSARRKSPDDDDWPPLF